MSVITDRALAAMEAIKGGTFTGGRAVEIAQDFNNDYTATNDETAQMFLDTLLRTVKQTVRSHKIQAAKAANESSEQQVGDDAVADL